MASFISQEITLMHPEKVNRFILYGASCGGKESIPHSPEVVKALSDFVYNRTQDVETFLSFTFPSEWIKAHTTLDLLFALKMVFDFLRILEIFLICMIL
jgi:hypothetical protein